jgi:hypothetical protein
MPLFGLDFSDRRMVGVVVRLAFSDLGDEAAAIGAARLAALAPR